MVFDLAAVTRHMQVLPEWCVGRVLEAATLTHPAAAGTLTHPADGNSKYGKTAERVSALHWCQNLTLLSVSDLSACLHSEVLVTCSWHVAP